MVRLDSGRGAIRAGSLLLRSAFGQTRLKQTGVIRQLALSLCCRFHGLDSLFEFRRSVRTVGSANAVDCSMNLRCNLLGTGKFSVGRPVIIRGDGGVVPNRAG